MTERKAPCPKPDLGHVKVAQPWPVPGSGPYLGGSVPAVTPSPALSRAKLGPRANSCGPCPELFLPMPDRATHCLSYKQVQKENIMQKSIVYAAPQEYPLSIFIFRW
ncbi:hypothetical protein AMTR_s00061p00161870 [Amborella trichopoda]|uniref:Uncharacterized protein n=1 Tax=Amborella trichopoda TaxID=13333 RepID=U5D9H3_AMBTC|nr:hypothetical protein AMTR_s00061p00161870 [Amborella trichopoda]